MTVTESAPPGGRQLTREQLATLWATMCQAEALDSRIVNGIKRGEFAP